MADSEVPSSTSASGGAPNLVIENVENPFTAHGALSKKADYIIANSTITRTELHIADPDNAGSEQIIEQSSSSMQSASSGGAIVDGKPYNRNGSGAVSPGAVEVEVSKATAAQMSQPQHAEEVKLKDKKKCCNIL